MEHKRVCLSRNFIPVAEYLSPSKRATHRQPKILRADLRSIQLQHQAVVTTREIGQAMLSVVKYGYAKRILEANDIRAVVSA